MHLAVWNIDTGEARVFKQMGSSRYNQVSAYSPDGRWIAATNGNLLLYDLHNNSTSSLISESECRSPRFSPNSRYLGYLELSGDSVTAVIRSMYDDTEMRYPIEGEASDGLLTWSQTGRYIATLTVRKENLNRYNGEISVKSIEDKKESYSIYGVPSLNVGSLLWAVNPSRFIVLDFISRGDKYVLGKKEYPAQVE